MIYRNIYEIVHDDVFLELPGFINGSDVYLKIEGTNPAGSIKIDDILCDNIGNVQHIVADAYRTHSRGETINPDSYFLRFPESPDSRAIALPAYLGGEVNRFGIKWISSFPNNIKDNIPRASAVLIINDYATGYPIACLEAAGISAARTAASASVALTSLIDTKPRRYAFIGAGVISRTILDHVVAAKVEMSELLVHDINVDTAAKLAAYAGRKTHCQARRVETLDDALGADVVILATTSATPYILAETPLRAGQLLLNISLRDLVPELLLGANNIVDDVEHCLKANTSPHLAEKLTGGREFITGTIGSVLNGQIRIDPAKPTVFSPFGLGVLDIAVGGYVLDVAKREGRAIAIPGFIGNTQRW